jgi:hypothetical protein
MYAIAENAAVPSCPTDLRSTFELFKFYHPEVGVRRLLQNAGVATMSPRQIYHVVHDRPPETLAAAMMSNGYDAVQRFLAGLAGEEFQKSLGARLLRAYPEKHRIFFVHIPKTAGVDLAYHLTSRFASFSTNLLNPILTPKREDFFLALKHLVLELACSDTIFISGHTFLGTYQSWNGNGIRYGDEVFTVVRAPMDQLLSQVNHVLTRIFTRGEPVGADTAGWRSLFGVENLEMRESRQEVVRLASRILRDPGVVVPNVICTYLGGGTFAAAEQQTVAHNLEVIELSRLDSWSEQRWDVTHKTRLNSSEKFVTFEDFSADDLDYARGIVQEDMRYFQKVLKAYEVHGGTSIKGAQIIL